MNIKSAKRDSLQLRKIKFGAKQLTQVGVGCILVFLTTASVHAVPTANNIILELSLTDSTNPPVEIFVNVHDVIDINLVSMVSGGPNPVYLESVGMPSGPSLPPNLSIRTEGNACLKLAWQPDDNAEAFDVPFQLIAGDETRSSATITITQGGMPLTTVSNPPDPSECDDRDNADPMTTLLLTETVANSSTTISPIGTFATDPNDQNGETLRLSDVACGALSQPSIGTVSRIGNTLTYSANAGPEGTDSFEYCVTDNPLTNPTATDGVKGTVNVTVNAAGAPEVLDDLNEETQIDVPIVIDVMANDPSGVSGEGVLVSATSPLKGGTADVLDASTCPITTVNDTGCIRYTPPMPDGDGIVFVGTDTFSYTVALVVDPANTNSANVKVQVVTPPGTPEAFDDPNISAIGGTPTVIDVLMNDTGTNLSIVNVTTPTSGTAVITQQVGQPDTITYTPDASFNDTDTFLYTISDGDPETINRIGRVTLGVTPAPIATLLEPFAQNATQAAVGAAVDVVCPALGVLAADPTQPLSSGQSDLLNRCNALIEIADQGDTSGVRTALQQIAGEEALAQGTTGVQILNTQIKNISSRIAALRSGAIGISTQGLALNVGGQNFPNGLLSSGLRGGGASADEEDKPENALLADSRLGVFINGRLNFGEQDQTTNEDGFDFETLGVTIGADYRFRNSLVIGGAVGYSDSEVDFNMNGGDLQSESVTYSVYGTYFSDKFYMDVLAGGGGADFDSRRIMVFSDNRGGVDTIVLGTTDGDQSLVSVSLGYNFEKNGWVIAPYVSYDYLNTEVEAYNETEGQGWELAFDKQDVKSQVVTGGVRVAFNKSASFGVFIPHLRVAFQKELEDDVRTVNVRFVNDPTNTNFGFLTAPPDNDFYRLGAGFSIVWRNGLSGFVDYESIERFDNLTSNTLTVGLRFERRF